MLINTFLWVCCIPEQENSLVNEVDCLSFELVGAVQVGQDEDLGCVLHRQVAAQRVLAHHLQALQRVLQNTKQSSQGQDTARRA